MTATMSKRAHALTRSRSRSHEGVRNHACTHPRARASMRAQACQCTGQQGAVRRGAVRYCHFSALKILVVFLQTHGFVLAFRDNYNVPIYRLAPARQR